MNRGRVSVNKERKGTCGRSSQREKDQWLREKAH